MDAASESSTNDAGTDRTRLSETTKPAAGSTATITPTRGRANWARVLLTLNLIPITMLIWVVWAFDQTSARSTNGLGALNVLLLANAADSLGTLLTLATAVAFLWWEHGVISATRALGLRTIFSPAAAVAYWFVPVAFLIQPPRGLLSVYSALRPGDLRRGRLLVLTWWLTWIFPEAVLRGVFVNKNPSPDAVAAVDWILLVAMVAMGASVFLCAAMIELIESGLSHQTISHRAPLTA